MGRVANADSVSQFVAAQTQTVTQQQTLSPSPPSPSPSPPSLPSCVIPFVLRSVVDVLISDEWCSGTVIKRMCDGSLKIALHGEESDDEGQYAYESHIHISLADKDNDNAHSQSQTVVRCINEDGEFEMDHNANLLVDKSITRTPRKNAKNKRRNKKERLKEKQRAMSNLNLVDRRDVRHSASVSAQRELSAVLARRRKKDIATERDRERISQSSDITEPTLSQSNDLSSVDVSPRTRERRRVERAQQFRINTPSPKKFESLPRSPRSPRRRKRSREALQPETELEKDEEVSPKRRKIMTRSSTTKQKSTENGAGKRRSPRLKEKKKEKQKEKQMKEKEKKESKKREMDLDSLDGGEEIEWDDDADAEMASLVHSMAKVAKAKTKTKKRKHKWTGEGEAALRKAYKKHAKLKKQCFDKYAIWKQIQQDSEYCHHWQGRTKEAIRDKTRLLLQLGAKNSKSNKSSKVKKASKK